MSRRATPHPGTSQNQPAFYHVRCKGRLGPIWDGSFEGLTITAKENGEALMSGPIVDQAALHGLLARVRDLGLTLVSIVLIEPESEDDAPVAPQSR